MIKVENIDVWGFEHAIRGMRNPKNSWNKSDTTYKKQIDYDLIDSLCIGKNDLDLMRSLYSGGSEHRKFMRQIFVSMDITAPLYWWKEMDQYKIGTVTDSCSTMHKIHEKKLVLDDFSHEHLLQVAKDCLAGTIDTMNEYRVFYIETKDMKYWRQMIQLLPSSYNQRRTLTMNYENVVNMIHQREFHKLDEWREFVRILKDLPYIKEIISD